MAKNFTIGQLVLSDGMDGVYRVVAASAETADIERFDISEQKSLGDPLRTVTITRWK